MRQKGESLAAQGAEDKRAYWVKRVSQWRGSGQTQKAFCEKQGIALSTFQWWRAKLSRSSKSKAVVSFAPVSVDGGSGVRDCAIEVELRSGTRLRLEGEAALRALDRLVAHPMILGGGVRAYVCTEPVDMRKSIDGLSVDSRPN